MSAPDTYYRFGDDSTAHLYVLGIGTLALIIASALAWAFKRTRAHVNTILRPRKYEYAALIAAFIVSAGLRIGSYGVVDISGTGVQTPFQGYVAVGIIVTVFLYGTMLRHGPLLRVPTFFGKREYAEIETAPVDNPVELNDIHYDPLDSANQGNASGAQDYTPQQVIAAIVGVGFALVCLACLGEDSTQRRALIVFASIVSTTGAAAAIAFAVASTRQVLRGSRTCSLAITHVFTAFTTITISLLAAVVVMFAFGFYDVNAKTVSTNQYYVLHTSCYFVLLAFSLIGFVLYEIVYTDENAPTHKAERVAQAATLTPLVFDSIPLRPPQQQQQIPAPFASDVIGEADKPAPSSPQPASSVVVTEIGETDVQARMSMFGSVMGLRSTSNTTRLRSHRG